MPLLECGCWGGDWPLRTHRPQCRTHGGVYGTAGRRLADVLQGQATSKKPPTIDQLLPQLIAAVHAEAGQCEANEETAAFDAWQHVIQTLRTLREQVTRAIKANTKDV